MSSARPSLRSTGMPALRVALASTAVKASTSSVGGFFGINPGELRLIGIICIVPCELFQAKYVFALPIISGFSAANLHNSSTLFVCVHDLDWSSKELRFITPPNKRLTVADAGGYYVATAHGPDLFTNSQNAIRYIIDYLVKEHNMSAEQAYCLCGAVDLKISEIVDAPNWIVSAYLPMIIFDRFREVMEEFGI